jgi:hypothetical protein
MILSWETVLQIIVDWQTGIDRRLGARFHGVMIRASAIRPMAIVLATMGCAGLDGRDGEDGESPESLISEATPEECRSGGKVLLVKADDGSFHEVRICNGQDGATGGESLGRIEASLYCGGPPEDTVSLWASHDVVFSDLSLWGRASIRNGLLEVGSSVFYSPRQVGAASASIIFAFDVQGEANGGYWNVTVDAETLDSVLTYKDADLASETIRWSKPSTADGCVVNRYSP